MSGDGAQVRSENRTDDSVHDGGQKSLVLDYMRRFGSITSLEAFRDLGITRLSAVVFDLRADGHRIKTSSERGKTRFGKVTRYARYEIEV